MQTIVPQGRNADLQSARDDELLRRFVAVRDQAAFEEIVRRHGPLVLSVCRRVLGHLQDAEDAFQATFLTLASRARRIKSGVALPSWLHRVATRIARTLHRQNAQRQRNMTSVELENVRLPAANGGAELKLMLDDELDRLPSKYKSAILLCDYYGYSRKEAAASLKVPIGTLLTNLKRGREQLKQRFLRCGVAVSAVGVASALAKAAWAAAPVSAELVHSTARLSLLFLAGQMAAKPAAPATAVHLAQSTIRRMTIMKLLSVSLMCVAVGTIAVAVPEIAQSNFARAQPFFVDDFEDGDILDGRPLTWLTGTGVTTQVTAGDLVLSGTIGGLSVEGSDAFRDVSVRTQFRFLTSTSNLRSAFVFARSPSFAGYYGGLRQDGVLLIVESPDDPSLQSVEILAQTPTTMNPFDRDVLLKFDVFGDKLTLTAWHEGDAMPGQPQLTVFDNTLTVGPVGLGIGGSDNGTAQVAFRSFSAVPEPSAATLGAVSLASFGGFVVLRRRRLD